MSGSTRAARLQIGPESAGASPGPVCYDQGGTVPTVTDANVLLGYINPQHLVGGALKLNAEKARAVFAATIAAPLKMTVEDAAYGAYQIAASNMIRAIRAVSSERGRDPREFALFAFGGNGPLFAAGMAAQLDIKRIVVPPCAGLFSSFGLLYADVEYHFSRTFRRVLRQADPAEIGEAWDALARQAADQLATDGFTGATAQLRRFAALHYKGQTYELVVPVPDGPIDAAMAAYLEEAFGAEHERTYGHRAGRDEPVELVSIQVIGAGLARRRRRAGARRRQPARACSAAAASGLFRQGARLDRNAGDAPLRPEGGERGAADRRGIRFNLRHPAGCAHRTRRRRKHRRRALATICFLVDGQSLRRLA